MRIPEQVWKWVLEWGWRTFVYKDIAMIWNFITLCNENNFRQWGSAMKWIQPELLTRGGICKNCSGLINFLAWITFTFRTYELSGISIAWLVKFPSPVSIGNLDAWIINENEVMKNARRTRRQTANGPKTSKRFFWQRDASQQRSQNSKNANSSKIQFGFFSAGLLLYF